MRVVPGERVQQFRRVRGGRPIGRGRPGRYRAVRASECLARGRSRARDGAPRRAARPAGVDRRAIRRHVARARTFPARDRPDQRGPTLRRGHRGRGRDTPHAGQPPHLHGVRQPRLLYLQASDRASPIGERARRRLRGHGGARERAHRDRYRHAPAGVRHARVCGRHDRVRQRVGHRQQRRRAHVDDPRRQLVGHQRRVPSRRVRRRIRRSGRPGPVRRRAAQPGRDLLYGCGGPERGTELRAQRRRCAIVPPRHIPARAAAPHQLQPARADPRGEPGGPLARRSAVLVRRRARGTELPPGLDDIRDVRLLGPGRRLRLSRRPRRSFPAAGERYRPCGLRRGMVVRALSGRPVRRLTDRPARADRAHRSRQRRGANRALVRDDDDQMGPRQLGVRPSRVRATRRGVLPVMVVTDRSSHRSPRRTRSTFRCRSHWCHRRAPAHK